MEIGILVIFALRILVPLTIFRWPLYGGIASLIIDAADTNIVKLFGVEIPNYVNTDKVLDMYYLTIQVYVSRGWENGLARKTSYILYTWRLAGVVAFEITGLRFLLFVAPNIFEHFFLLFEFLRKRGAETAHKQWINSYSRLALVVFVLWLTKIPQELVLHVFQVNAPVETFIDWVHRL